MSDESGNDNKLLSDDEMDIILKASAHQEERNQEKWNSEFRRTAGNYISDRVLSSVEFELLNEFAMHLADDMLQKIYHHYTQKLNVLSAVNKSNYTKYMRMIHVIAYLENILEIKKEDTYLLEVFKK